MEIYILGVTPRIIWKIVISLSYWMIILGSFGLISFVTNASGFATNYFELDKVTVKIIGILFKAKIIWITSWSLIIFGTFVQSLDYIIGWLF